MNEPFEHATPGAIRVVPSNADLLALLQKRRALTADELEEAQPFFFSAEVSSTRLDSHFTHMSTRTLKNFAADLKSDEGVSFQNSHRTNELPFGRSLSGRYEVGEKDNPNHPPHTIGDFYTVPGLNLNGVNTTDLIKGIRTGLVRAVSVTFCNPSYFCDLCKGRPLFSGDCRHAPGVPYIVKGETEPKLASAEVDAELAEVSPVYKGSTPGAAIVKARQLADAGHLLPEQARLLESRYRGLALPVRHVWTGHNAETGEPMDDLKNAAPAEPQPTPTPEPVAPVGETTRTVPATTTTGSALPPSAQADHLPLIRATLTAAGITFADNADPTETLRTLATERQQAQAEVVNLNKRVVELTPLADEGRAYRVDLVDAALAEGVRALGPAFAAATYKPILEGAPISTVKRMTEDWKSVAQARFVGGRKTTETSEQYETKPKAATPDAAFAG